MMETFSPIDSVELLSSPVKIDAPKSNANRWIWFVLIAIILAIGIGAVILYLNQKKEPNAVKPNNL